MPASGSRSAGGLTFEALDETALAAERGWWAIYEDSFPPEEKEPHEVILRGLRRGAAMALAARDGAQVIAIAATTLLRDPPAVFVNYLAVAPARRGFGVGSRLLDFAWGSGVERLATSGRPQAALIWEVEIPELADQPQERMRRERRIGFYRRLGGEVIELDYRQPPLQPGTEPIAMHLMYRAADSGAAPDRAGRMALAEAIYREKYGAINQIAPEILTKLLRKMNDNAG